MSDIARHYRSEALRLLDEGRVLYPPGAVDPGDARPILHPPGYSVFMAGVYALLGRSDSMVRLAQIILDALSAVMLFLIAAELFSSTLAVVAATLATLSPHLAYYSLWITPDTLCVLPILVAVYLVAKTSKRPRLIAVIAAGVMVGLSCWLRANALLLAPLLAVAIMVLTDRAKRVRYAAALVAATVLVISPIAIRNWILFHHFIPISIAGGENLVVGIADFDKEGRFGMPGSDADVGVKEAEWYNRPEYAYSAWFPDGVERDQARYIRGLEVIRSNPSWFLGVMFQRAFFMLRYNDSGRAEWPFNTSRVPIVSGEPAAMHALASAGRTQLVRSNAAPELLADNSVVSQRAEVSVESDSHILRITGDASEFADKFASVPIVVKPKTDYLLTLEVALEQGPVAAKVTSSDLRIALASEPLEDLEPETKQNGIKRRSDDHIHSVAQSRATPVQMVFASGDRNEVRLVISNNGSAPTQPLTELGQVELYDLGATRFQWTRFPRLLVRGLQKNLFKTNTMLPLVIAGVLLLALARRGGALVVLLAVPAYYLCAQSTLSTEYRYILAIHYFLFIMAAVALCLAGTLIRHGVHLATARLKGLREIK